MANDVYTYISYGDEHKKWDLFTAEVADEEYHTENNEDGSGFHKLLTTLVPEHKDKFDDWDYETASDVLDTKWCHIHNVDEGSIEFHSAWNAPTGLLDRIQKEFGKHNFSFRIEDYDSCIITNCEYSSKDDFYYVQKLSSNYYDKFISELRTNIFYSREVAGLLKDTTYRDDELLDRYEAVDFIKPVPIARLDEVVLIASCYADNDDYEYGDCWMFDTEALLNGLSNTTLKEATLTN